MLPWGLSRCVHGVECFIVGHVSRVLAEEIFKRDRDIVADTLGEIGYLTVWDFDRLLYGLGRARYVACPAVVIDIDQLERCWGRWTIEHVPDTQIRKMGMLIRGMRRGQRAPDDREHLISLCEGHTEPGMKGGRVWNTANRPQIREYLVKANQ